MTCIGWLQDDPGYVGGAELTALDFLAAAPDDVEIVDCPPHHVKRGLDAYVVHNCMSYTDADRPKGRLVRFIHDERGPGPIDSDHRIFYSPLQRDHVGLPGEICPAPLNRARFKPNGKGRGTVHVGTFGHFGKGQQLLAEWAQANEPVVVYGHGPLPPTGSAIDYRGAIAPEQVPEVLQSHERFVHLPTRVEGYGRGVAEAWASGCDLVINRNVGCLWWLENEPEALDTAAERFWEIVLA